VNKASAAASTAAPGMASADAPASRTTMWTVFFLTYALFMHDYLSRQVITSILPVLKVDWTLSDAQLGALVSVVALTVAVLTIPLSLVADRWGRVRSITLMAVVWSLATVACGMATSYYQMLAARAVVGFGEAAYGAAGAALLAHAFPARQRATVLGAFQSAAMFGSVLGVVLGGAIAAKYGWRMAFFIVGAPGLLFAVLYPLFVRDYKTVKLAGRDEAAGSAGEKAAGAAPESLRDRKRTLTRQNLVATLVNFLASAPALVRGLLKPRTSRALREKVVLAVTAINDCRYCAWGHTHWAMANGVSLDEVNRILGGQDAQLAASDPAEAAAILFAQHCAEHHDRIEPDATENLRRHYSAAQVEEIIAYIRAITLGNLLGNSVDAFLGRFRRRGNPGEPGKGAVSRRAAQIAGEVFRARSGNLMYLAYGLQIGIVGFVTAWTPTYLNRYFAMPLQKAATMAAVVVLALGIGLVIGGAITDRLSRNNPRNRTRVPALFAALSGTVLLVAFALPPGPLALGLMFAGALFAAAPCGPAVALAIEVTHPGVRATVTATVSLFGNGLGNAVMPYLVGLGSDVVGLKLALTFAPLISLGGALCFVLASSSHEADAARQKAHAR